MDKQEQNISSNEESIIVEEVEIVDLDYFEEEDEKNNKPHQVGVLLPPLEDVITVDQEIKENQNLFQLNYKKIANEISIIKEVEEEIAVKKEFIGSIENLINWMNSQFNKNLIDYQLLKPLVDNNEFIIDLDLINSLDELLSTLESELAEAMLEGVEESRKKSHDESSTTPTRNNNNDINNGVPLTYSPNSSMTNLNNTTTPIITNAANATSLVPSPPSITTSSSITAGEVITSIVFSSSLLDEWYTKIVAADEIFKHQVYEQVKELISFYQHEKFRAPINVVDHVIEIVNNIIPLFSDKISSIRQTLSHDRHIGRWFDSLNESDKWISDISNKVRQLEVPDLINKHDWTDEKQNIENFIQERCQVINEIKQDVLQFEDERICNLERKSNDLYLMILNYQPSNHSSPNVTNTNDINTISNSSMIIQNPQEDSIVIELMKGQLKNLKEKLSKLKNSIDNLLLQTNVEKSLMIIGILESLQSLRNEMTQIRKSIIDYNDADMVKDDIMHLEEKIKNFEKQLPLEAENNLYSSSPSETSDNNNDIDLSTTTTNTVTTNDDVISSTTITTSTFTTIITVANTTSPSLVKALKNKHNKLLSTIQNIKIALAENKLQMVAYLSPSSPSSPISAKQAESEQIHGLTCNDDHIEELNERYDKIESELITFERSLWVQFWLKSESAKRLHGEEVVEQINKMEKKYADIKNLIILRQKDLQIIKEGREFAKGVNAIRDQLDIVKGKMRRQDTKTDASIQELNSHMTETLEMLKNLESAYQHLLSPDVEDKRYSETIVEQQNQYNLVQAWIEEVKIWFKEAERMRVWIDERIVILENSPKFDAFQEDKVPATREQVDEWQDDCDKLELEIEKFDAEDMTRLRAHVKSIMGANTSNSGDGSNSNSNTQFNEAMSPADTMTIAITLQTLKQLDNLLGLLKQRLNDLTVLSLRVQWEHEFAKALNRWNELINNIKDVIVNKVRWKQPVGIRDDDEWLIDANQPNNKDLLIEIESIVQHIKKFRSKNIPETGQILDELVENSLVEVPEHLLIRQENLEERDLTFLKNYYDFCRKVLQQRQEVLEYAQVSKTTYINGLKLNSELIEEEKNPKGGSVEKEFIARVEELGKHIEQAWSNIGEKVIYPHHSNHDQNENHLVKEGVDTYHHKMEDLKLKINKALKDYQDALRLIEKELLQRSDDLFNNTSNLEDWVDKRLAILEEHRVDPLTTECLYNEEQVKDLLKEHEEFLAENNRVDLDDINQIKEGIEKLVEDIKSSKCDDIVNQKHLHDAFKKLAKKFAELQSKTTERQSDLSALQSRANWEDQFAPGMQSLNDLINEVDKFISEKARWKPDYTTHSGGKATNDPKQGLRSFTVKNINETGDDFNDSTTASIVSDTISILTTIPTNDDKTISTEKDTVSDEKDINSISEESKINLKQEFKILAEKAKEFHQNVLEPLKSSNKDMVSAIKNLLSKNCPKHLLDRQLYFEKKFDYLMDRVELGKNVLEQHDAINDFLNQANDIIDWVNPHLEVLGEILNDCTLGEFSEDKLHDLLMEVNKIESEQQAYTDIDIGLEVIQFKKAKVDDLWQELQDSIPKTKQQLDQALQVADFKEKIRETLFKIENLSNIISSSLVDEVTKDNIKDWQIELNGLEQTELFSLIKLHDNVQESLSMNTGPITEKESAVLENLLRNVANKISDLKKQMNKKIDEVESRNSAQITAYLTKVNDLQSWIEQQFEIFVNGKSQHGVMVETSEQTNKENLENLSIIFSNFQKQLSEKFEQFNSIIEEFNNITSQEGIHELQDVIKSQTELSKLWEDLDLGSNEFKDFINKVGKWYDQHDMIYRVENDIFVGLGDRINKLVSMNYDNLEFEVKELDDKLQNAKKMLEEAKIGANHVFDVENDILDNTNRQNFNKHHFGAAAQLTELSNRFQKALTEAHNASLLAAFRADADRVIGSCLEGTSIVKSRHEEFNSSEYYSLEADALKSLINDSVIGFSNSEETLEKFEAQINVNLKAEADRLIGMNPEANKDRVLNIFNKVTQALGNYTNSISAEKNEIETARKIYPHAKASEDVKKWISSCKMAVLNIQAGALDQEREINELEEKAMKFQSTDGSIDRLNNVKLQRQQRLIEVEPKIKDAVEARTNKVLDDWCMLTDLLGNLRSSLNASKEAQEVSRAIKDILVSIGQVKERVLNVESFFIGEGVPRLPTKDDVENNLKELDEIQVEVDHILGLRIESLDEMIGNLLENETSFVQQRSGIAEALTNLAGIVYNKRSQLHEAEKLAIFGSKADEMNALMSSLLELVDITTKTDDGSPLSSLPKIELNTRLTELETKYAYYQPKTDQKLEDAIRASEPVKDDWRVLDRLGILKEQWLELIEMANVKQDELRRLLSGQKARTTRHERSNSQTLSTGRAFSPNRNTRSSSARPPSPRKRGVVSPGLKYRQSSSRLSPSNTPNRLTPSPVPGSPGSPKRPAIRLLPHTVNNYIPDIKDPLDVELARIVNACPVKIKVTMVEGEPGRYMFGEIEPKICYCRILRSRMVMVRVGGGWTELSK
ncbi:9978_t:CDS:2 [Entrophospora sp. SA101]|nr:9978_t:CDS:2 [Entrophospora sp. SA101]